MKTIWITIRCLTVVLAVLTIYILTQQPKVWCNTQWAGIALTRGGYRSWSAHFCDGETLIDGRLQPCVITPTGVRAGHYRWPKFNYVDIRHLERQIQYLERQK